jgi:hypothetical protein
LFVLPKGVGLREVEGGNFFLGGGTIFF